MSHDGDKLIRQLSLVAYLMAERRPVTARDAKNAVEGYSEMSDEAFARRFYADRAELLALGVGITSQRDEFTGEELYTLQREDYFLPPLHLDDAELAALQTCLYLLEGQFAYSEPLRLALQNLALGRPNPTGPPADSAVTLNLAGGGYSPEIAQRLAKLETAISKQRTIVFRYFAMNRGAEADPRRSTRTASTSRAASGTSSAATTTATTCASSASRASAATCGSPPAASATSSSPRASIPAPTATARRGSWASRVGEAVLEITPSAAWLVERLFGRHGTVEIRDDRGARFTTAYASLELLTDLGDRHGRPGAARLAARAGGRGRERARPRHGRPRGRRAADRGTDRDRARAGGRAATPRRSSPVAPERFAVLQAMLADLLESCGDEPSGEISATDLKERYGLTDDALVEQVNLLNLVNFGGGCYAVYAEFDGDTIKVEKELYGEEFRRPARLSPLEAKAILMALDLVGPAGRGRRRHHARRRATQGRVGVRALRAPRDADAGRAARGGGHPVGDQRLDPQPPAGARRVPRPQRRRHDRARRRAVPAARRRLRLVPRELRPHRGRRAHVPRRPHPRRRAAARDVRAARRPRGAGRAARAARPLRHRVGVVRARDRRPRDRDAAVQLAAHRRGRASDHLLRLGALAGDGDPQAPRQCAC